MPPSDREWGSFYDRVFRRSRLDLNLYKQNQLRRRIVGMMEGKAATTLERFGDWVLTSEDSLRWFMDKLAINVSELFRNPEKWLEMERKVLPDVVARSPRLKIWSAGCSYGAEAHTLAAILEESFKGHHAILGTDIDAAALEQASRGEFSEADTRGVPDRYRKYFCKSGNGYQASASLRKFMNFRKHNLLEDRFETGFDLICCRNVVIYFNDDAKDILYGKFYDSLKPGGYLFVGSTERIFRSTEIGYETALPFYYQKPLLGDKAWRNAS